MTARQVVPGLHRLTHAGINAYIIDEGDAGLTMIDAGLSKHADALAADIRSMGRDPGELTSIVLTHGHPDHLGSAKRLSAGTVPISLHPDDSHIARAGVIEQTMRPPPGLLRGVLFRVLVGNKTAEFPAFEPDRPLMDGDVLDIAGGLEVIHTPGHTAGHVSLLWKRDRGLLITGDAAANILGLDYMLGYDDFASGKASLTRLAGYDFEAAVFGHGRPIMSGASQRFAAKFGRS